MWFEFLFVLFYTVTVRMESVKCDNWELTFLGTGACFPTPRHALSSIALRLDNGEVFLFDCGEGTQLQLMKSILKPTHITKIFITHLHGDHFFGLPGLLSTMSAQYAAKNDIRNATNATVHIYGPLGLRNYIRHTMLLSESVAHIKFKVHELSPPTDISYKRGLELDLLDHELHNNKFMGGSDFRLEKRTAKLFSNGKITIYAGLIIHKLPTYGYVVEEKSLAGRLDVLKLRELGIEPGPVCSKIKHGHAFTAKNGRIVHPEEVLGPRIVGRKVTILGDTSDPSAMASVAMNSDVLVHEATFDDNEQGRAMVSMHSTPFMAVSFAKKINAKTLILNHFSQRYKPNLSAYQTFEYGSQFLNDGVDHKSKSNHAKRWSRKSLTLHKMRWDVTQLALDAMKDLKRMNYNCTVLTAQEFMTIPIVKHSDTRRKTRPYKTHSFFPN